MLEKCNDNNITNCFKKIFQTKCKCQEKCNDNNITDCLKEMFEINCKCQEKCHMKKKRKSHTSPGSWR